LINVQIKNIMYFLIRDTYLNVLDELEKDYLRPKDPASWTSAFCGVLVLCMCAEMVQINSDFRVVSALDDMSKSSDGLDKNGNSTTREDSIDVCLKLDDLAIASAVGSFHLVYRAIKFRDGPKLIQGFNPIRDGPGIVRRARLGQDVEDFVVSIQAAMAKHRNELGEQVTTPTFRKFQNVLKDHNFLRKHNSGRLVSGFLRSMTA